MFYNELRKIFSGFTTKVGLFLGGLGVPANFITFLVLVSGFGAGYCIYLAEFYWAIFLILFSGLMDAFDGAVAKANHKESKFGGLLDSTTDKITEIVMSSIDSDNSLILAEFEDYSNNEIKNKNYS